MVSYYTLLPLQRYTAMYRYRTGKLNFIFLPFIPPYLLATSLHPDLANIEERMQRVPIPSVPS